MSKSRFSRRRFLATAAGTGAVAAAAITAPAEGQEPAPSKQGGKASGPSAAELHAEHQVPPDYPRITTERTGSDFMIEAIKTLDIDYVASLPGSSFRALQESFINNPPYPNKKPEFLTCLHEEAAVAMAHGYARVARKPMLAMIHGTVGVQHASMAIYGAYCDRVPMLILTGSTNNAAMRRQIDWKHSAQDNAAMVRDFIKWDDQPTTLQHWANSTIRGYQIATSVPMGPAFLVADTELQEDPIEDAAAAKLSIPRLQPQTPPQGDENAVRELAKRLVAAEKPVIVADRYARTDAGMGLLVAFAELLQAPVIDYQARLNFPSRHPLNHTRRAGGTIAQADLLLALEPTDLHAVTHGFHDTPEATESSRVKAGVYIARISSGNMLIHSNYQEFGGFETPDLDIGGDAEATMPLLIDAVRQALSDSRKAQLAARGKKLVEVRGDIDEKIWEEAANGWDASPISTARLAAELWRQVKSEPNWAVGQDHSTWVSRIWDLTQPWHAIPGMCAGGVGQESQLTLGAALAHKQAGRFVVSIVGDGDLMMSPGVLWTAARYELPMLLVVQNNRAYHQEVMHIQRMANRHNRGIDRGGIGGTIDNPNIDFAVLARSMGVHAEGPVTTPRDLAPAIKRALETVKSGQPALIEAVTQPR